MKFGQVIEYNKKNIFFKSHRENETARLVPGLFLLFEKALFEIKKVVCSLVSIYFNSPQLGIQKNELYKTLEY